jgi:outer membrane protein insertion porin family
VNITDLVRQLLVPSGQTYAFSQRLLVSWDRRDNPVDAKRGTYVATGIEHVDAFKIAAQANTSTTDIAPSYQSHFFKLQETFDGYVPIGRACPPAPAKCNFGRGIRIASQTRLGANVQLTGSSQTYPDRLFFMGGTDSMRGWALNSFIPQDIVDLIEATKGEPDFLNVPGDLSKIAAAPNPKKITPNTRPIRGGDLMAVQRIDLRIPLSGIFETAIFTDIGNLWTSVAYPFDKNQFPLRADAGAGLRVQTPVGPLAIDYGINLTRKKAYEDFGAVNFSIGVF